jgi:polysaccharide biosynthesis transport protein
MSVIDMNNQRATVNPVLFAGNDAPFVAGTERFADQDGGLRFRTLFDLLRRRLHLIATITIGGALVVAGLALFLPPRYTAKAQLVVEESRAPRIDERVSSREAGPDQATIQTQVTALSSHDLLAKVIAQLSLDPTFRPIQRRGLGSLPDLSVAGKNMSAVEELERHLKVFQEAGSHVISVVYTSKDPAEAAAIANKITDYYLAAGQDQSRLAPDQAVTVLTHKIADLRAQSESLEATVAAYEAAHGINDASKTNVIDQKLGDLNHQLSSTQAELAARRTRRAQLLAFRGARGDWAPLIRGLDAQGLVDLHGQVLAVLEGRQDSIAVIPQAGEASLQGQAVWQLLRDKVRKELDQALVKLSYAQSVATAQAAAIEQRLSAVQRASDDVRLHDLVDAAAAAHHRYERLVQRRDQLLEQGDDVTASARLLTRAAVPHRPSSLNPLLFLAPGIVAFLMLGCLVALLRDRLDQGIYRQNDVASVLGLRCAGFVPLSRGIIPSEGTARGTGAAVAPFTEALRGIMVSLQLVAPHKRKPQVILVTSSVPGEGKTTLALGLAACAVRMGAKVLLLDMDARAVTDMSAVPGSAPPREPGGGVVDLLAPDRALIEAIPTGLGRRLDYLPVRRGPAAELPPLFSGDQMSELVRRRWSGYDLIFIDSAPVLAKAEVRLLAAIADQIVFAVRWRKTRRDDARAALALLRGCGPHGADKTAAISGAITQVDLGPPGALGKLRRVFSRPLAQLS